MTPETRSTTHFFWNYLHDFDIDNPNIALSLRNSLEEAFNEDLAIIEAQQKVFDADPNYQLLADRCGCRADLFPLGAGAADRGGGEHGAGRIGNGAAVAALPAVARA